MVLSALSRLVGDGHNRRLKSLWTGEKPSLQQRRVQIPPLEAEQAKGFYPEDLETIRAREFPLLKDTTYLDHGGATLYARSLIEAFSQEMTSHIFGNPHSASVSSQLSTQRVDDARLRLLRFFNASPDEFDLVFVANATGAIKLVTEAMRDYDEEGFWYGYHIDSHTSLVGPRNTAAQGSRCFLDHREVEEWIDGLDATSDGRDRRSFPRLFAYPAQSNMTGSRLGLDWCKAIRTKTNPKGNVYTLYDAAAYVLSSPLDLSDPESAPDFTALSLYKIFGYPDLGVLIVRKSASHIFERRKYFGGGTVGMVVSIGNEWHAKSDHTIHNGLEDGTLPFHNIVAVHSALDIHYRLYGSMQNVSRHTASLIKDVSSRLDAMRHFNGTKVCELYKSPRSVYGDPATQGPVIAFNLKDSRGSWIGKSDVEKLATVKNIHIRSGGLCNPGGIASFLHLTSDDMKRNYAAGVRCGDENDIMDGKPSGVLRVSVGAMTNIRDIDNFVNFISDFYVEKVNPGPELPAPVPPPKSRFYVERLCVYPIKSCGAFVVPKREQWEIRPEGLAWDREWCLVHLGTNIALSQKKYPRMALINPVIDLEAGLLRITCGAAGSKDWSSLQIPLFPDDTEGQTVLQMHQKAKSATVCQDVVAVQIYSASNVTDFFSAFLGVPCTLARFPPQSSERCYKLRSPSSKQNGRSNILPRALSRFKSPPYQPPILLSNESPMLLVSRSSVNKLNEMIKQRRSNARTVPCDVFRANIIVAEDLYPYQMNSRTHNTQLSTEHPYIEDSWSGFRVGGQKFDVLSSCQRCQMVCIDQDTGVRNEEPYSTLAKTRKFNGKVYFGRHVSLASDSMRGGGSFPTVKVGDAVLPFYEDT
ncbi:hypothetical protein UREG_02511 [Uncinocarpus reesii 1704]|uniref:Molybdenum cofactor sulfurase n=1 Tax=Uncinocarpus reesii (strain UAMH 1704) TaxID=336963 RepID=C4JGB3_UNCRE|nr:uncharacterized protein UREG_02511 [Uncinocarpus reesii 1704]EEP77662.1 hypothetical protein UREG_02511 [Uncinocarpus reesii 1704]